MSCKTLYNGSSVVSHVDWHNHTFDTPPIPPEAPRSRNHPLALLVPSRASRRRKQYACGEGPCLQALYTGLSYFSFPTAHPLVKSRTEGRRPCITNFDDSKHNPCDCFNIRYIFNDFCDVLHELRDRLGQIQAFIDSLSCCRQLVRSELERLPTRRRDPGTRHIIHTRSYFRRKGNERWPEASQKQGRHSLLESCGMSFVGHISAPLCFRRCHRDSHSGRDLEYSKTCWSSS